MSSMSIMSSGSTSQPGGHQMPMVALISFLRSEESDRRWAKVANASTVTSSARYRLHLVRPPLELHPGASARLSCTEKSQVQCSSVFNYRTMSSVARRAGGSRTQGEWTPRAGSPCAGGQSPRFNAGADNCKARPVESASFPTVSD